MKLKDFIWPVIGLCAVAFSVWLLYHELRGLSLDDIGDSLTAIPVHRWLLAAGSALLAYAALAGYDRIALQHLGKRVGWLYITIASFTTYAISHNIGASVFSGAMVRYRAYVSQGLNAHEVGMLVALCSLTFALGTVFLAGLILVGAPQITERFVDVLPVDASRATGKLILLLVALYIFGSWLHFKPRKIGKFVLQYPRLDIVAQQLVIGPLELIGAAGIIYFALPAEGNPGFIIILGVFLASFSVALLSHAPGGIGVLEIVFLAALPDMAKADVLTALLVFRMFYLIIPFVLALVVIVLFERSQFSRLWSRPAGKTDQAPS